MNILNKVFENLSKDKSKISKKCRCVFVVSKEFYEKRAF